VQGRVGQRQGVAQGQRPPQRGVALGAQFAQPREQLGIVGAIGQPAELRGAQAPLPGLVGGGQQQVIGHAIGRAVGGGQARGGLIDKGQLPEDDQDQQAGNHHDRDGQGQTQGQVSQQGEH